MVIRSLLLILIVFAIGCDKGAPPPAAVPGKSSEVTGADRKAPHKP